MTRKKSKSKSPPKSDYRKQHIPKALREQCWVHNFGKKYEHKCYIKWCSNRITVFDFHVGHNIPECKGGKLCLENVKPICSRCNHSMGSQYTITEWMALDVNNRQGWLLYYLLKKIETKSFIERNTILNSRGYTMPRSSNGNIEKRRLNWLVNDWNIKLQNNDLSLTQMFIAFNIDTNLVDRFIVAGGSTNHFDIIILMKDGNTINIEHKAITETENNPEHPWSLSSIPQLINGPYNLAELSIKYCNVWYNLVMPDLKLLFPTLPELPTYNDWLRGDASMGSATTKFGKALKEIRKADKENAYLIDTLYKNSIKIFWKNILENNPDILEQFKQRTSHKNATLSLAKTSLA